MNKWLHCRAQVVWPCTAGIRIDINAGQYLGHGYPYVVTDTCATIQANRAVADLLYRQDEAHSFANSRWVGEVATDMDGGDTQHPLLVQRGKVATQGIPEPVFNMVIKQDKVLRVKDDPGGITMSETNQVVAGKFHWGRGETVLIAGQARLLVMVDKAGSILEFRSNVPQFGEQHDIQHSPQVGHPGSATGAALEANDPFYCCDMPEPPLSKRVFQINKFFSQLI